MSDAAASRSIQTAPGHLALSVPGLHADSPVFSFEQTRSRAAGTVGATFASYGVMFGVAFLFSLLVGPPEFANQLVLPDRSSKDIVWLNVPGPGGGGGGGGNRMQAPPKKAELPGQDKVSVPVTKPPQLEAPKPKDDPEPIPALNIPAKTLADATTTAPGVIESNLAAMNESQGPGIGGGAGTGTGTGIGPGRGSGLGPGEGGGTGGGVYRPGSGVEMPRLVYQVRPQYTADAMRAKVQGTVVVEAVVLADGTVGEVHVTKSLDPVFGLDQEAIKAAKQWRFVPGSRFGQPVAVLVGIELTFTLR